MKTKAKIFHAMLDLIQDVGLEKASIGALSKKTGLSPGNIYYHFTSKHVLISELYLYCKTLLWENLHFEQTTSLNTLKSITFHAMDFYAVHTDIFIFIHSASLSSYLSSENIRITNKRFEPLYTLVQSLGKANIISNDSVVISDFILSLIHQYVQAIIQNKYKPSQRRKEQLWELFLHGVSK